MREHFNVLDRSNRDQLQRARDSARCNQRHPPGASERDPIEGMDPHLVSLVAPGSVEAEHYRRLRVMVERMHQTDRATAVAVSSPVAGDGKSTTAINLAGALAQDPEARVVLVETDLHQPSGILRDHLALRGQVGPGLVDAVLDPGMTLETVVRYIPPFNLSVLQTGSQAAAPYEVLKSPRFGELLAEARRRFDYLILDASPFVPVADCRLIEPWVDGFLMVVAAHRTPRGALEEAFNLMKPDKAIGLVFNGDDGSDSQNYKYGYGYGNGYGHGRKIGRNQSGLWARILGRNGNIPERLGT